MKKRVIVRRSLMGTLIAAVLTMVLLVLLLLIWLQTDDFDRRVGRAIEVLAEQQLGEKLHIDDIEVELGSTSVELRGIELTHHQTGDTIATADRVRVPVVLRGGGLAIGQLTIDKPEVTLHVGADGKLVEFQDMAPGSGEPLQQLPFNSLALNRGSLTVTHPEGELQLRGIQATPTDAGPVTDIEATLDVQFRDLVDEAHIDWKGVVLGPDLIRIPDLALDLTSMPAQGLLEYQLGGELDLALTIAPNTEELNALLEPPRAVRGTYDVDLSVTGKPNDPQLQAVLRGERVELSVPGISWPVLTYRLGDAVVVAQANKTGADIESLRMDWADGVVLADGRIEADGTVTELHVTGDSLDLERILVQLNSAPTPWVGMTADAELDLTGSVQPLSLVGDFDLAVLDLDVANGPLSGRSRDIVLHVPAAHASGAIELSKDGVILDSSDVTGPDLRGSAHVDIGFKYKGPLDMTVDLAHVDLSRVRPLGGSELMGTGQIRGRFVGPFDKVRFTGTGELDNFAVGGIPYADRLESSITSDMKSLSLPDARARKGRSSYGGRWSMNFKTWHMDTAVSLDRGRIEDMVGMFVDVEGMRGDALGQLELHGPFNDLDGSATLDFQDVDLFGEHFDKGRGRGRMQQGRFVLDDLSVQRRQGAESIRLTGRVDREYALDMRLATQGLDLTTLDHLRDAELPVTGALAADIHIGNTLMEPAPEGQITLTGLTWESTSLADGAVDIQTTNGITHFTGKLLGGTVALRGTFGLWDEQPYELDAFFSQLPAHVLYSTAADGAPITGLATGSLSVWGHMGDEPSPVKLSSDIDAVDVRWRHHALTNPTPWHYEQEGERWSLTGFSIEGGTTDLMLAGDNHGGAPQLAGRGTVDLDLMRVFVPGLVRAEGTAVLDATIKGRGDDRDTLVSVSANASLLEHGSFPGQFEDVTLEVLATEDKYNLLSASGSLGGGTVSGSGRILASDWMPTRYELSGHARDAQLQWVDFLPPAIGDADFTFDGPGDQLLLSADVVVSEMTFSDRIDWEDWVVEFRDQLLVDAGVSTGEAMFAMDVHVVANETVRLRNNVAEGTASADLRVIGDTARPGLVGQARIGDGIALLQDREFQIERGEVRWHDPYTWDPELDIELLTDLSSRDQNYRVTYRVLGPFSDWRTETRSEPSMSQADINALLWFGVTADDLEGSGQLYSAIGQAAADMVLADLFVSGALQGTEEISNIVDRVDVATGVNTRGVYSPDPRLIVERRFEELGDTRATYELNLLQTDDWYLRLDNRVLKDTSISGWYATKQRGNAGGTAGAVGVDLKVRKEWD